MLSRCYRRANKAYASYGGRGITVCDRWRESFEAFLADMGERPPGSLSIDRKDNGGNYRPGNCRWATAKEQARNTRSNRVVVIGGVARCLAEWAELSGVPLGTLWARLRYGWSAEDAISRPLRRHPARPRATQP